MPNVLTRRRFLTYSGVAAATTLAGCGGRTISAADVLHAAAANPLDPADRVLVVVSLYGGNDGLNTVVPAADPAYARLRPDLAYQAADVLELGDGLGLNPGMKGLKGLWDNKKLAIVRGVGYPDPDHSHFRSMAIWQTAAPDGPVPTGWLGRWLDDVGGSPLDAVALDPVMPPLMAGLTRSAASFGVQGSSLPGGTLGNALAMLGTPCDQDGLWQAAAAAGYADLKTVATTLEPAVAKSRGTAGAPAGPTAPAPTGTPDPGGSTGPSAPPDGEPDPDGNSKGASAGGQGQLAAQLDLVAAMVELGTPTRAYSVSLGGFDTHADERGTQQRLLTELDTALTDFQARLDRTPRGRQVVTMVFSEFGRRVAANASDGTDHGTSGPMFLLGDAVRGGFFGDEPSLTDLTDGDLKVTTDFRSVYATLFEKVLAVDPGKYLQGWNRQVSGLLG